ncbi:citramalate synthase [Desulfuribacillus alkaliarsenatis]|uniref:Citramalate synthase n=1 Tax=Desulfuribacillus alkaliarsenatis TaxID=766136 RepID=A0A1E5G4Z3_9FIRM|nr:citramalate synthase [Desulfuribacillus alkaliarsenatis]OEF98233.1 citramalate synthase [Desulfuribacillus alkaliarsenatis]
MKNVYIYDTTLRDGTQGEGISFSSEDKLKVAKKLDSLGVAYIEGGWPGSNPKDLEFFKQASKASFKNAKLTAFGSTRRAFCSPADDSNLNFLIESGAKAIAIFGKTWDFQVIEALRTTLEENLKMIEDSVAYLKSNSLEVIFDAEHFFDGYKANPEYAIEALKAAERGGADCLALCDTNGGSLPHEIEDIVAKVKQALTTPIGIHAHNDGELAVANSIAAVRAGATQVQGTMNGFGERCGNANLCSIIPNLQLKSDYNCIGDNIKYLTEASRYISEIANVVHHSNQPFVGRSAFTHKGGMHVSAILKNAKTYEHIEPETVGNQRRVLMSELAGQSNVLFKAKELGLDVSKEHPETKTIINEIKELEHQGYQFEAAEASFELLLRKAFSEVKEIIALDSFKLIIEKRGDQKVTSDAIVKLKINGSGTTSITADDGNGPVNALDNALRKTLEDIYPTLKDVYLTDYKVRVIDEKDGTAAKIRVLIESSDGETNWSTVGVSENIIDASWQALTDSYRYALLGKEDEAIIDNTQLERKGILNH